jgi:hypothetical protein
MTEFRTPVVGRYRPKLREGEVEPIPKLLEIEEERGRYSESSPVQIVARRRLLDLL